ncbi:hypothetical protein IFR05_015311 [Cadophora sp. M221]|nr:hypothetical protein IFR05_015311 [Cadophora sp. M221]
MNTFILAKARHQAEDTTSRPALMVALTLISIIVAYLFSILQDFLQTFLKRPRHFLPSKNILQIFAKKTVDVPLVDLNADGDYKELLARGSNQYPDRPYKFKHFPGEVVILPHKWMNEIKSAPESKLSFQQASFDILVGVHTGITGHDLAMASLIRRDVGRLLDRVYTIVDDEAMNALKDGIGPCEDWTEILLLPKIVRIIIKVSQRVFVGEPLCRDERWLATIANCTSAAFSSVTTLWEYNWLTRPFVAWRHPGLLAVRKHKAEAREIMRPVLEERLKSLNDPSFKPPPDLIQLVIDGTKNGVGRTLDYQVNAQIGTGRAALFTTGVTVFHLIYDLCMHPEYVEPLRQEVLELGNVQMNRVNVAKLVKMDSFIRECQRWSKFMLIGTMRKVIQPLKLPDGMVLPVGTLIAVDTQNAVFDHSSLESPEKFDGFRFAKLREIEGNGNSFQAVSTGPDHLVFGYGSQACPGRFFAIHEAKVTLARLLLNYEFKLKEKPVASPMARTIGVLTVADPSVKFLFKARK